MNHQTPFLTQDLVAMALEKSAQHVRLHTEGQRLAGEKVASAQVSDEEESYPTERVEKLASAIEEIIPVLNEKEAGFESIGGAVRSGAAGLASKAVGKSGVGDKIIAGVGSAMGKATDAQIGKGVAAVGGGLAAAGAGGALAHKALSSEKRASMADKLKGAGSKAMEAGRRGAELLTGSKAKTLEHAASKITDPVRKIEHEVTRLDPEKRLSRKVQGAALATGVTAVGAGTAKALSSKKEAEDKLAAVVDKIKTVAKRGKQLVTGSRAETYGKSLGRNLERAMADYPDGAHTMPDSVKNSLKNRAIATGKEGLKVVGTRAALTAGAVGTGVAAYKGLKKDEPKKEASAVDSFLASKLAYSAPAGEGKPPSFGSAPHVQGTVTQTGDAAPGHTGGHFTSPETFSNRSTLPGRRAEMRQYFKNPMNDQHEVPEFSHKTASATETARDLLARLAQEGK